MSKNKAIHHRLEEIFAGSEPLQPAPPPAVSPPGQEVDQYTYVDMVSLIDHDLKQVMAFGAQLSSFQALQPLLVGAVTQIVAQFGLYSAQLYLLDTSQKALSLRAAAGASSHEILRRGRTLSLAPQSALAIAVSTAQPVVIYDVHTSHLYAPNPFLPDTRCQLVLPLLSGQKLTAGANVFGGLDLYLDDPADFNPARQNILALIASRLAAAIEKLIASETRPQDLTQAARTRSRLGWEEFLDAITRKEQIGYQYEPGEHESLSELPLTFNPDDATVDTTLAMPLLIGGENIGSLHLEKLLNDQLDRAWSPEERDVVRAIAERVALHLDNLRLLSQAERYQAEAEEAARRLTREGWDDYMQVASQGPAGFVYDSDQVKPLAQTSSQADLLDAGRLEADLQTTTYDLRVRDEVIGEFSLDQVLSDDALAQSILSTVSERLSTHIENLRLLEETERSRQQLDRRAAELETVARVSTAAATILSPQELLQSVVDLTRYSFNLYHVQVYMLRSSREILELMAGSGKIGHRMVADEDQLSLSDSSVPAQVALTRQGVIVNDIHEVQNYTPHALLPDVRSELAVPMIVGDQLLGVFHVLASISDRFNEEDMRIFTTLASQVSVALRNAELYAEQMAAVVRLRELDHLKNSFLANMSHELRTPLNSILGFTQVILEGIDGPLTEDMDNDLSLIEKNGHHLLNLINEILDMAKIEAGRMSLSPEPVDLRDLLNDVIETSSSLLRERDLYLVLQNEQNADITLMLDYTRMRQVFLNVIGNAAKFTDQGGITVSAERKGDKLSIRVQDTGIGIPPDKLESVFEAFSQVDTSTTRKAGGTGLGLPISRRLVEMHGGRLWAESTGITGQGSCFVVELSLSTVGKA